ncbi:hypothetical protein Val02_38550 [Virgisporangium aliadipatigenens]|uniref:Uncharacterized protein n=1 Tax=Virgisporangium aliadipatigenens TaxID=741659 RepID=A0A8J3YKE0_9ACTN|nr:hypothetical protein [Virgisporangium aliadipatigenens]GIJ46969.1 hypothetical protein Val02_38550 [Virgisporangium aliadipatigenens]
MWRNAWRAVAWGLALVYCAAVLTFAGRLYSTPALDKSGRAVVADALPRLAFLRDALEDGAGEDMQRLFPEGYFFSYALYGLAWVDVGMRTPERRDRARAEAQWAMRHLESERGKAPFDPTLTPPYGVFYAGWTLWLRGGLVRLGDAAQLDRVRADSDTLAQAFSASESPFLQAYPHQSWPCDSTVAIAALALGADLTGVDRGPVVARWLAAADARRDPATGLLPHRADPVTGAPLDGARATSQVIILRFLREVAPERARADYRHFVERHRSTVPGAPGVREYPRGVDGSGDVDSGPLVLGLSMSASAVALGNANLYGDRPTARRLAGLSEAVGMRAAGRYLGGAVPVADAFLVWSHVATGWRLPADRAHGTGGGWWRLPWSAVIVLLLAGPVWRAARHASARPTG